MTAYSVYLPPSGRPGNPDEEFRLVADTKAPWALVAPPIWLIAQRLWLELLVYLVLMVAIGFIAVWQPGTPVLYLSALPGLYLLLEGNQLIASKLERDGWQYAETVEGDNKEEAEIRYLYERSEPAAQSESPKQIVRPTPILGRPVPVAQAGLFPE